MSHIFLYASAGVGLFILGVYGLIVYRHLLRKILALNIIGSGVFLVMVSLSARTYEGIPPDPAPHAMIITGIVVAVSATALALALMLRIFYQTGLTNLPEDSVPDKVKNINVDK